jgi:glycosyltransferase involved in cell wall biosynthesis
MKGLGSDGKPLGFAEQLRVNLAPGAARPGDDEPSPAPVDPAVRLIAFYLPQFHPIPENDLWWGRGFTEWSNVTRALPRFAGHYQPHLPGELGFYDLRLPDTLRRQAALARQFGVGGFCFHHYWFGGRRLLETPIELLLAHPDIDLSFCICWANENWTRRWDGAEHELLIGQSHSPEDDIAFARHLEPMLRDRRYIRVDGRPLLIVYRVGILPDPLATARRWRAHLARAGLGDPYLVMAQTFGDEDPRIHGFDAAVQFPPHALGHAPSIMDRLQVYEPGYESRVLDYDYMADHLSQTPPTPYPLFRTVCPGWDNEARRPGRSITFAFSTPEKYGRWLETACRVALEASPGRRLVFVNAWNEWAEGAHLEPDRHFGRAYLHATARVLATVSEPQASHRRSCRIVLVSHDAHVFGAQIIALRLAETLVRQMGVELRILLGGPGPLEDSFRAVAPTERVEGGFGDGEAWRSLGERLRADGFEAVLCNTLVSAQAIGPLRAAGLRPIALVHELPTLARRYGLLGAARQAAEGADAIVFPAPYVRDRFAELAGSAGARPTIRPQGTSPPPPPAEHARLRAEGREALGATAADRVILGAGGGDLRKGIDLWPALVRRVLERQPDALFVWAGKIEPELLAWLQHDLAAMGHADRLRLPGLAEDMRPLYAAADLFLLTSREDPFPSVVLEAMAHGLPVVGFADAGGFADLVRQAGGALVPYLDVAAMADAACRLLEEEDAAKTIGAAGRTLMGRDFRYDDYAFDLLRLAQGPLHKVSVIVPNYNYARYLGQRLESIWSQTYPIYELIVLDDASTDDSEAVLDGLRRSAGRSFELVRNTTNSGAVARQWALGVERARGELVWLAEADDFADPTFLATVVPAFDDPGTVLSYAQSRQVDEHGAVIDGSYLAYVADIDPQRWQHDYRRPGPEEIAEALAVKNTIPNVSAALFRREALARVLHADAEAMATYRNCADWLCYLKLLQQGSLSFSARPLNNHRRHRGSVTLSAADRRHLDEIADLQRVARTLVPVSAERQQQAARWHRAVARQFGLAAEEEGGASTPSDRATADASAHRLTVVGGTRTRQVPVDVERGVG